MDLFTDYTLRNIALGSAALGIVSGALGAFAVLRRQSLLGDAVSHAALPGIVVAFMVTGSKAPLVLMAGAGLAGWLAMVAVMGVTGVSRVKFDAALGLALSVFFGAGMVLLTHLQRHPRAQQAGLDTFLFGQAAALVASDVATMATLGTLVLAVLTLLWKEFKLLAFDPDFARSLGLPVRGLDLGLTSLTVAAIVLGLQTVGVVLMSAMLVAPAAAARQWTDRLATMLVLSGGFGAAAGVAGAVLSATGRHLPTGPMIVLCAGALVVVSLLLAPRRGLVPRAARARRSARRLKAAAVLLDLGALAAQHPDPRHAHEEAALALMSPHGHHVRRHLATLARAGLVEPAGPRRWRLTAAGAARVAAASPDDQQDAS